MPKVLYTSPDIPVIDYTNIGDGSNAKKSVSIDERELAPKAEMKNDAKEILEGFTGYIRAHDFRRGEDMGGDGSGEVLRYLLDNIPDTSIYLSGLPEDATDEQKVEAIRNGLEGRSRAIDEYNNRVVCEAPFLGNNVEEARSKQEIPEVSQRYKTQYERVPSVKLKGSGRGSVVSYKTRHNPKPTGMKFL